MRFRAHKLLVYDHGRMLSRTAWK